MLLSSTPSMATLGNMRRFTALVFGLLVGLSACDSGEDAPEMSTAEEWCQMVDLAECTAGYDECIANFNVPAECGEEWGAMRVCEVEEQVGCDYSTDMGPCAAEYEAYQICNSK